MSILIEKLNTAAVVLVVLAAISAFLNPIPLFEDIFANNSTEIAQSSFERVTSSSFTIEDGLYLKSTYDSYVKEPQVLYSNTEKEENTRKELSYRELICSYGWNCNVAYAVMMAESGGNSNIVNFNHNTKDYSVGLFQINLYGNLALERPSEEWLKNPENNIEYAYKIYQKDGWNAWGAYRNKSYLKFLR